ncbi:hypothetical protein ACTQZS_14800 [Bilifractor sp. LCP19S3_H10]|uniref:hypothetical protein n=1 Tax=Bilifractor sp. LCP19S3_H10 TaxID=3438736 RepID=UPI003F936E66
MVYCDYIDHSDISVKYAFGQTIDDITGTLEYDFVNGTINIINQPKKYKVLTRQIESLFSKYRSDFANGTYRRKIAYEA